MREEKRKQKEFLERYKPYLISDIAVKWIIVFVFVAFVVVFLFCALNPPDSPYKMFYSGIILGLGGLSTFFTRIIKSIVPMFDKYVEKETDIFIQIK